jgi:hypothetical protein
VTDEAEEPEDDAEDGGDADGGPTPSEEDAAASADEWAPPRELMLLLAGLLTVGSAGLIFTGYVNRWTAPTLGVVLATGLVEAMIAMGLATWVTLAGHRQKGLYVSGLAATALGAFALVGILLLSGEL